MTNSPDQPGNTGRMLRDVAAYTLARLMLVAVLTAVILFGARLINVEVPLVVAILFALVIAMPLGIWLLSSLRRKATESIAVIDEGRRKEREKLQSRLRGEKG